MKQFDRRSIVLGATAALFTCRASALARSAPRLDPARWRRWTGEQRDGVAAFLAAVARGDVAEVRSMLMADGSLLTACDESGRSAFVLAALAGREEVCAALREHGLELDIVEAVLADDWERVRSLAAEDPAQLDVAHPIGGTPLYAAALGGMPRLWRLRSLGCDPDARPMGGSGFTPAHAAMEARTEGLALKTACDLLGNGADVTAPQKDGDSILHAAVRRKSIALVRLAVRKGADVAAKDAKGRTAQVLADELEWADGMVLLADHASLPRDHRASRFAFDANRKPVTMPDLSDVPRKKQDEVTGVSHGRLGAVKKHLAQDPRLSFSRSLSDELAIEACGHVGHRGIIALHLANGAPYSLPTAVTNGDAEHVTFLLDRDQRLVHERGAHDFPLAWFLVSGGGDLDMAERLFSYGLDVNQESAGVTTLHRCAQRRMVDLAAWLIEKGADVNAIGYGVDPEGQTPLDAAEAARASDLAKLLRQAGGRRAKE